MAKRNPPHAMPIPTRPQLEPGMLPGASRVATRTSNATGTQPAAPPPVSTQPVGARAHAPFPSAKPSASTGSPAETAAPLIAFENVHLAYPGAAHEALAGISCRINAGEHVCVLGANGSGKSTFAQLISALVLPTNGTVQVAGINTADASAAERVRRQVASVFQHPEDQLVTSIVADDVAFGPENIRTPQPQIAQRVDEVLAQVGMSAFAQRDPEELSGGQQQRVAIAGALAMHPRILVLDEPGAMLDTEGRRAIGRIVARLVRAGITVIHVTHFMDDALAASRVLVLEHGHLAFDGAPADLFDSQPDRVEALHLEVPFALKLHDALGAHGIDLPRTGNIALLLDALAASLVQDESVDGSAYAADEPLRSGATRPQARRGAAQAPAYAGDAPATTDALPADTADAGTASASSAHRCSPHETPVPPVPSEAATASGRTAPRTAAQRPDAALAFEHVSFSYDQPAPRRRRLPFRTRKTAEQLPLALNDISFAVEAGAITALVGHTGSGKSTTAELACALKQPLAGRVLVDGIDTADRSRRGELRRRIGYVSQLPERQLFAETVFEDVAFGPRNLGFAEDEVRDRVREALTTCGLEPTDTLLARSPFALSGGQQRAVAIAGVLAMRQPILVLDEPMAGLDPAGRARMRKLLAHLRDTGTTILLVTHDMDDVAELADRVIALAGGHLVAQGTPRDMFRAALDAAASPSGPCASPDHGIASSGAGASPALDTALLGRDASPARPAIPFGPDAPAVAGTASSGAATELDQRATPAGAATELDQRATSSGVVASLDQRTAPSGLNALGLPAALAAACDLQRRGVALVGSPLTLTDLVQEVLAYAEAR